MNKRKKELLILISLAVIGIGFLVLFIVSFLNRGPSDKELQDEIAKIPNRVEEPTKTEKENKTPDVIVYPYDDNHDHLHDGTEGDTHSDDEGTDGEKTTDEKADPTKKPTPVPATPVKVPLSKTYFSPNVGVEVKYPATWTDKVTFSEEDNSIEVLYKKKFLLFSIEYYTVNEWNEQGEALTDFNVELFRKDGYVVSYYLPTEHPVLGKGLEKEREEYNKLTESIPDILKTVSVKLK